MSQRQVEELNSRVGVNQQGRVTLPKRAREAAGIKPGDTLYVHVDKSGELVLETRAARLRRIRSLANPTGDTSSAVDELIADRRAEAAREEREGAA
ncbi:AbrB/MazE/SpoVT family DNA-binding domain-containing protein [Saccharomonospora sp. CUA-673]|uniref:AbrB/MazE/SpoVT family DNA-binding domain-containing protein n=1 Tax=Saccharomonospora sp. CUA-673 TaxID=1904969 RepID=UPI00096A6B08|nr:AbrB/MazE/SpoVT family DNA-binding domain-containing protein [Saccharomonospora sp. CUA-673]